MRLPEGSYCQFTAFVHENMKEVFAQMKENEEMRWPVFASLCTPLLTILTDMLSWNVSVKEIIEFEETETWKSVRKVSELWIVVIFNRFFFFNDASPHSHGE